MIRTYEPLRAVAQDVRQVGQGLDVVDDGRFAVQPLDRRERRLETRLAAPAPSELSSAAMNRSFSKKFANQASVRPFDETKL